MTFWNWNRSIETESSAFTAKPSCFANRQKEHCEWSCHVRCCWRCKNSREFAELMISWNQLASASPRSTTFFRCLTYESTDCDVHVWTNMSFAQRGTALSFRLDMRGAVHIRLIINHNICASIKRCLFHIRASLIFLHWRGFVGCKWIHSGVICRDS